jgi:hypothetical protein
MQDTLSDEECIAILLLHGGRLWWNRDAEFDAQTVIDHYVNLHGARPLP